MPRFTCGIAGRLNFEHSHPVMEGTIARTCAIMRHRAPHRSGDLYRKKISAWASRRLSIIDLSTGKQPIRNEDRTIWTVLNGEIYNYVDLRTLLRQKGHQFLREFEPTPR